MTLGILRVGLYERVVAKCAKGNNMNGEILLGNFRKNVRNTDFSEKYCMFRGIYTTCCCYHRNENVTHNTFLATGKQDVL